MNQENLKILINSLIFLTNKVRFVLLQFTKRSFEEKIEKKDQKIVEEYKTILKGLEHFQKELQIPEEKVEGDSQPNDQNVHTNSTEIRNDLIPPPEEPSSAITIFSEHEENFEDQVQFNESISPQAILDNLKEVIEIISSDEEEEKVPSEFFLDEETELPQNILKRLMSHQPKGIKFLWENIKQNRGCILADFMGLGKSLQTLIFIYMYRLKNPKEKILILCPLNVAKHWENECKKLNEWIDDKETHLSSFNLSSQSTITGRRNFIKKWKNNSSILIITYELYKTLIIEQEFYEDLVDPGPELVILDEGHRIRNFDTKITKNISKIKTLKRIILTGYPFQNNLLEYYTMINFISPGLLGEMRDFKRIFEKPVIEGKHFNAPVIKKHLARKRAWLLHYRVKDIILRRDSSYLTSLLPKKFEITITVDLNKDQRGIYSKLLNGLKNYSTGRLVFWSFDLTTMLCNHPDILYNYTKNLEFSKDEEYNLKFDVYNNILSKLFPKDYEMFQQNSFKFDVSMSIILESQKIGDKVVLFSRSIQTLNYFEKVIKKHNLKTQDKLNYVRFDGSTGQEMREDLIEKFNNSSNINLFLISTLAGGEGINLFSGNRIILFDVNWNPCHDAEACCRVYRYGQKKQVYIYRLITHQTMEDIVYQRQLKKEVISRWVIDDQSTSLQSDSNQKELFIIPQEDQFEKQKELIQQFILEQNDIVTNEMFKKYEKNIYSLVLHNELLREDEDLTLTEEEKKRAHAEEEWDIVYGKKRTNPKESSSPNKRKKYENKYSFKEDVITSEDESPLEDDEDEIVEEREEKVSKKGNLTINTSMNWKKSNLSDSPKSTSSNSPSESPYFHKKLEEEKKKMFSVQQKHNDFRKLVREQMNDFKSKVTEFYKNLN